MVVNSNDGRLFSLNEAVETAVSERNVPYTINFRLYASKQNNLSSFKSHLLGVEHALCSTVARVTYVNDSPEMSAEIEAWQQRHYVSAAKNERQIPVPTA